MLQLLLQMKIFLFSCCLLLKQLFLISIQFLHFSRLVFHLAFDSCQIVLIFSHLIPGFSHLFCGRFLAPAPLITAPPPQYLPLHLNLFLFHQLPDPEFCWVAASALAASVDFLCWQPTSLFISIFVLTIFLDSKMICFRAKKNIFVSWWHLFSIKLYFEFHFFYI